MLTTEEREIAKEGEPNIIVDGQVQWGTFEVDDDRRRVNERR